MRRHVGQVSISHAFLGALSALLARSYIHDAPSWWVWFSLVAGAVIAWLLVTFFRQPVINLIFMWLLTAGIVYGCFFIFNRFDFEVSPIPFSLALNGCACSVWPAISSASSARRENSPASSSAITRPNTSRPC